MIGKTNSGGSKSGGILKVTTTSGIPVTASNGSKTYIKTADERGVAVFKGLSSGTWTVSISDGDTTTSKAVEVTVDYEASITLNMIPEFTYTGDYEIVNDADEAITTSSDNWKIRLLTSGTLTFNALNGAESGIDVFCVGGGGGGGTRNDHGCGGGGGGYTTTERNISLVANADYEIVVGAGGSGGGGTGGQTSAFEVIANGGAGGSGLDGGAGGSGGGGGLPLAYYGGAGGSDGSNGKTADNSSNTYADKGKGGAGQGTTTREFGEDGATLYSGGGGGGCNGSGAGAGGEGGGGMGGTSSADGVAGVVNTGGGGGGKGKSTRSAGAGGSGIVIIRNARG